MKLLETQTALGLKNILFLTDFSLTSEIALAHAVALAGRYHAKLTVAHFVAPEPHYAVPLDPTPREMDISHQVAAEHMRKFLQTDPLAGLDHQTVIVDGHLDYLLPEMVRQSAIDLIVLGTHGRTGMKKVLLGSIAEQILRVAPCPVLTVGPEATNRFVISGELGLVLFATNFAPESLAALPYACTLAQENHGKLALLHVMEESHTRDEQIAEDLKKRMLDLLPVGVLSGCQASFLVEFGAPAEIIPAMARKLGAELIVIGVHAVPHPVLAAHLPWPVLTGVVAHAPCAVLTLRVEQES